MMTASSQRKAPADPAALPGVLRHAGRVGSALLTAAALSVSAPEGTQAEERSASPMAARVEALIPELEAYIQSGMKAFDVPGLAIGIVTGDRLVYAKGFGVRRKRAASRSTPKTVFQIGSTTKALPRHDDGDRASTAASSAGTTASSTSIRTSSSRTPG